SALRRWLLVDMDAITPAVGIDPAEDPESAIEYLIGLLPDEFADASCWWQWSSSAGLKGDHLSAHLWFWLNRPLGDGDLARWAKFVNAKAAAERGIRKLVDRQLFTTNQPHYTARAEYLGFADT